MLTHRVMHYPITVASLTLKSPKDEVNGLQVEVIAQRAPRLPVKYIFQLLILRRNSLKVFQPESVSACMSPGIANTFRSPHLEQRLSTRPELDGVTENPTASTEENRVGLANKFIRISSRSLGKD